MKNIVSALPAFLCVILLTGCSRDSDPQIVPEIVSISPDSGSGDMLLTIYGREFGFLSNDNVVKINGVEATIRDVVPPSSSSDDEGYIKVIVPQNAGTGPVTLTTNGKTATGPVFNYIVPENTTYFISFKADGVAQEFTMDVSQVPYYSCGACSCHSMSGANGEFVWLGACSNQLVSSQMLLDLKGKTLPLRDNNGFPYGELAYSNGTNYFRSSSLDNIYATMKVIDVKYHSSYQGSNAYNISGTFEGIIEDPDENNSAVVSITEGKFLLRFTAGK